MRDAAVISCNFRSSRTEYFSDGKSTEDRDDSLYFRVLVGEIIAKLRASNLVGELDKRISNMEVVHLHGCGLECITNYSLSSNNELYLQP